MKVTGIPIRYREDKAYIEDAIRENYSVISYLEQTEDQCLLALSINPGAFNYIRDENKTDKVYTKYCNMGGRFSITDIKNYQTDEICLAVVRNDGEKLRYVKNQTDEICLAAVKNNGRALEYVENQTNEICLAAVKEKGFMLEYVKRQTDEICLAAVKSYGEALKYVKKQTDEICLAAVRENGHALEYVENQTNEICLAAIKENSVSLQYVKKQTDEICLAAVKNSSSNIQYVENPTEAVIIAAVKVYANIFYKINESSLNNDIILKLIRLYPSKAYIFLEKVDSYIDDDSIHELLGMNIDCSHIMSFDQIDKFKNRLKLIKG